MKAASSPDSVGQQREASGPFGVRELWIDVLVVVAYFILARFDLRLAHLQPGMDIIWLPAGIAFAAIVLKGNRIAPALFIGSLLVELTTRVPFPPAVAIAAGNTAEAMLGGYLINRFAGGVKAFSRPAFVMRFALLGALLSTFVSAFVGTSVVSASGLMMHSTPTATLAAWWAGHALGVLVLTPFLVLLLDGSHHPLHLRELTEMAILLVGLSAVCIISFGPAGVFSDRMDTPLFLCVPFLVWAGIRFCPLEVSGACLVLCGFATWGSIHGYGPFANNTAMPLALAAYLCVATAMSLVGSATVMRQKAFSEQLLENLYRMEQAKDLEIHRLTSELDFFRDELIRRVHAKSRPELDRDLTGAGKDAKEVIWFLEAETENTLYVSPSYETVWGRSREELGRDAHDWLDAVVPEDREYAIQFVGQDFPSDRADTTYRIRRPDGSIRWIFDRGFVIRDPSGRAIRYLGLASDITEQVEQGEVVPVQFEKRSPIPQEREARTQIRRRQE